MFRVFPPGSSVPKGVGGWLLLLIVMLAVYTPGTGLRALYLDFVVPARLLPALLRGSDKIRTFSGINIHI